jgi:ubiquinone/menaquinone biosynthesis C-methylase UbiE
MVSPAVQRDLLGPALALTLWSWAYNVFLPARHLRRLGLYHPKTLGSLPDPGLPHGGGRLLSVRQDSPQFLSAEPEHYDSVREFDHCAADYDAAVKPFSDPIYEETVALMAPYLTPDSRILDPSSGPGNTAIRLSRLVPTGEVIAADLSRGMVTTAHSNARTAGIQNMAFFQADVSHPPDAFADYFDAIFCCLSFHHYPDAPGAIHAFRKVLRPGGVLFIADGGPEWFVRLARDFSKLTDPGFVQHRTGEEFLALFDQAGFSAGYWVEALPGIGISVARR